MIENVINLTVSNTSILTHISWNMMSLKFYESFSPLYFASFEYILIKLNKTRSWLSDFLKTDDFKNTEKVQNEISSNENDCCSIDCIWNCWDSICWCCFFFIVAVASFAVLINFCFDVVASIVDSIVEIADASIAVKQLNVFVFVLMQKTVKMILCLFDDIFFNFDAEKFLIQNFRFLFCYYCLVR